MLLVICLSSLGLDTPYAIASGYSTSVCFYFQILFKNLTFSSV